MMRRPKRPEQPLLHTVEEATQLVRNCGVVAWTWWFVGTLPFAIGLLHFTSDMSRAASAPERLPGSALMLALLYWWMKIAQAVFADHLLRQLRGDDHPPPMALRGRLRFITSQALIHCTAPWVLCLSLVAMLPFGWAYAAYHNVSVLALSTFRKGGRTRDLVRTALMQSNYRQRQNHGLFIIMFVLALVVWLNWYSGTLLVATVAKMFTGTENEISRNPMMMLSTGIFTATLTATYLVVGPFVKALHVLRCFYSLSRRNGEDIETAFRASSLPVMALLALMSLAVPSTTTATPSTTASGLEQPVKTILGTGRPAPAPSTRLDSVRLEKQIQEVLKKDIFQWRMPRDKQTAKDQEKGWLEDFIDTVGAWCRSVGKSIGNLFDGWLKEKIKAWLRDMNNSHPGDNELTQATPWADTVNLILKGLLALLGVFLVALLIRQWRHLPPVPARADTTPAVNLESDQVVATQLPENEWLRLAEEKINAGEFRLAMRALFLATLAHLGERKMLGIVRSKSNGDYVRELSMRARGHDELRSRFSDSVRTFDWAWYGWHDVTRELLDQFRDNHQHIITDGPNR
ncbi:MAG: hypothetical protein JWO08_3829 [Verrucomicrobiaceae bacterium]|nr:hypothetical protein [Verrucomicrobiaceae bacterium]